MKIKTTVKAGYFLVKGAGPGPIAHCGNNNMTFGPCPPPAS